MLRGRTVEPIKLSPASTPFSGDGHDYPPLSGLARLTTPHGRSMTPNRRCTDDGTTPQITATTAPKTAPCGGNGIPKIAETPDKTTDARERLSLLPSRGAYSSATERLRDEHRFHSPTPSGHTRPLHDLRRTLPAGLSRRSRRHRHQRQTRTTTASKAADFTLP